MSDNINEYFDLQYVHNIFEDIDEDTFDLSDLFAGTSNNRPKRKLSETEETDELTVNAKRAYIDDHFNKIISMTEVIKLDKDSELNGVVMAVNDTNRTINIPRTGRATDPKINRHSYYRKLLKLKRVSVSCLAVKDNKIIAGFCSGDVILFILTTLRCIFGFKNTDEIIDRIITDIRDDIFLVGTGNWIAIYDYNGQCKLLNRVTDYFSNYLKWNERHFLNTYKGAIFELLINDNKYSTRRVPFLSSELFKLTAAKLIKSNSEENIFLYIDADYITHMRIQEFKEEKDYIVYRYNTINLDLYRDMRYIYRCHNNRLIIANTHRESQQCIIQIYGLELAFPEPNCEIVLSNYSVYKMEVINDLIVLLLDGKKTFQIYSAINYRLIRVIDVPDFVDCFNVINSKIVYGASDGSIVLFPIIGLGNCCHECGDKHCGIDSKFISCVHRLREIID
jgi:hypothetical protein